MGFSSLEWSGQRLALARRECWFERNQKRASVNGCSAIVKRERVLNHARFGSTTESL